MAKIRAVTGFEYGFGVWSGSSFSDTTAIEKAFKAATNGELEVVMTSNGQLLSNGELQYPKKSSSTQGYKLYRFEKISVVNAMDDGFEYVVSYYTGEAANTTISDSVVSFEIDGNTYKIQWSTDKGFYLYDITGGSQKTFSGDNTVNKTANIWQTSYVRVWRDDDGSDTKWYVRVSSSVNSAKIAYFSETISGVPNANIQNIKFYGNTSSGGSQIEDLTLYEPNDASEISTWTTNWDSTTNDFNPQVHEVALIQTGGTEKTIDFYEDGTTDWKASNSTVESDISDSDMTTYAEVGTVKTGWKMDGSKVSDIPITFLGDPFPIGQVVGIAAHLTNVADDGDDEVTAYISSANAKQPNGTTHTISNAEQSHIMQTANGNASQLIHYFDFFDDPIDSASLDDLIVAHKLTT